MATTAAGSYHQPHVASRRKKVTYVGRWSIAPTTGVATLLDVDDPQMTLTRTAAGTYALVYPASPAYPLATPGQASIKPTILNSGTSAAGMVRSAGLSAIAPSLGTATIQTFGGNSGVAIDALAADIVTLTVEATVDCNT